MAENEPLPPLKDLHSNEVLVASKLIVFSAWTTDALVELLCPPRPDCLKTRSDGTVIDGNHRIHVLRTRAVNVDLLPREIIVKEELP
jgi:hypothetical protein